MSDNSKQSANAQPVKAWREATVIPTYPPCEPDRNPMFFEKRGYQGSSGKVYPNAFTDRLSDEKVDMIYNAAYLENQYIKLMVLPELGGRIQSGTDKINDYNFIYHNRVIKPALIGLYGPWVSGGIEFNWPQHHRPTTFEPVEHLITENEDGSKTIWLSEIEPMTRMKSLVGITLHPGKAFIEVKVQLYNATPLPQTFLWWANLAVHVNENYQAVFPPDIDYVADHAKRAISSFPIATGIYGNIDYSTGVDISRYKNIPMPASYMALKSDYDFLSGYDFSKEAGFVHIANHHISPGKKLFTWGTSDFGRAWDRNLTDEDGPYIELMTGVYSDNQPDFAWMMPYETKTFTQYWYPIRGIGAVQNATVDAAINLKITGNTAGLKLYTTGRYPEAKALLTIDDRTFWEQIIDISPESPFTAEINLPNGAKAESVRGSLFSATGKILVSHQPLKQEPKPAPEAAKPALPPLDIQSNDELYLTGLHLEQYRHPTCDPIPYYEEALRRDPLDSRCNNALGLLNLRRGAFPKAEQYFKQAITSLTRKNPNPYDGEPFYHLGLALKYQGRTREAYAAFYKSTWNYAWQSAGYYALAELDCMRRDFSQALDHINRSLTVNSLNTKARNLKVAIFRKMKQYDEALKLAFETVSVDILDFWSRYELCLILRETGPNNVAENQLNYLGTLMRDKPQSYLEIAIFYGNAGLWDDAISILDEYATRIHNQGPVYPMIYYYLGYYSQRNGDLKTAEEYYRLAGQMPSDYCFPSRPESIAVLENAISNYSKDAKANYYLGNLLYDKKQYPEAIQLWEKSRDLDDGFAIVHRNLSIAYFNIQKDPAKAKRSMEKAFAINSNDARILMELDQLHKLTNTLSPKARMDLFEKHSDLITQRDDLYVEKITLHNYLADFDTALEMLAIRKFHPWEGGEGRVSEQYIQARFGRGKKYLNSGQPEKALIEFQSAFQFPENLSEGKRLNAPEARLNYYIGLACQALGDQNQAKLHFEKAASQKIDWSEQIYYQGLALQSLGRDQEAEQKFQNLIEFSSGQLKQEIKPDYFGFLQFVSLIFEDDLAKRNTIFCRYLMGLGYLGLGRIKEAKEAFQEVLSLDSSHQGANLWLDPTYN
jgi:tetratricopeptide (TPR) repeat protein